MAERQPPTYLASSCYEMSDLRLEMQDMICGEGVAFHSATGTELKVSPSVTALNVAVAAGGAFVQSSYSEAGIYHVWNDGAVEVTLDTPDVTNRRIDIIVARVIDPEFESGDAGWALDALTGTPSATIGAAPLTQTIVDTAQAGGFLADLTGVTAVVLGYVLVNNVAAQTGVVFASNQILDARSPYERCVASGPYIALQAAAATAGLAGAGTLITLATTEHLDPQYFSVSGSIVTVLKAGLYDISAYVQITAVAGAGAEVAIRKNGLTGVPTIASARVATSATTTGVEGSPTAFNVALAANDNIRLVGATSGAGTTVDSANNRSRLVIRKVG